MRIAPELHEPRLAVVAVRDAVVDAVHALADAGEWPGITPHPWSPTQPRRKEHRS